jgi:hypothetical protein
LPISRLAMPYPLFNYLDAASNLYVIRSSNERLPINTLLLICPRNFYHMLS